MVGMACGDALGAPYEFGGPYPAEMAVEMRGGGPFGWEPGEWTDDTSMAIPLLELATHHDRMRDVNLAPVVFSWLAWMRDAKDVGNQTSAVLGEVEKAIDEREDMGEPGFDWSAPASFVFSSTQREWHEEHAVIQMIQGASESFYGEFSDRAGNGSLMRTAPVALPGDSHVMYAGHQSRLTHKNADAMDACLIWTAAIAHAIDAGELDLRSSLWALDEIANIPGYPEMADYSEAARENRRDRWLSLIEEAEAHRPEFFTRSNGWVVAALQAAWSSIVHTGTRADNDPLHLQRALEAAVRAGGDTDTVAAIAGALIGAAYGVSAIPLEWQRVIHGWPGWRVSELIERAVVTATGRPHQSEWPVADRLEYADWGSLDTCVRHPFDPGVYLGAIGSLDRMPADVDAVVSLCRVGRAQVSTDQVEPQNHIRVWLVDSEDEEDNQHVDFVLREAADLVARLRAEGRVVLLHCVQAHSRTPSVGALYAALHRGVPVERAIDKVVDALPMAYPNRAFRAAIERIVERDADHA